MQRPPPAPLWTRRNGPFCRAQGTAVAHSHHSQKFGVVRSSFEATRLIVRPCSGQSQETEQWNRVHFAKRNFVPCAFVMPTPISVVNRMAFVEKQNFVPTRQSVKRWASKMARYSYACASCAGLVTKTPCIKRAEPQVGGGKSERKADYSGLHGWKCSNCGDGVKVARKMAAK